MRNQVFATSTARFFLAVLLCLLGSSSALAQCVDNDNDGYTTCQNDCDDSNPNINPGVDDDDCDGFSDD